MKRIIIESVIITSIFIFRSWSAIADDSGNRLFTSFDKNISVSNFAAELFAKTSVGNTIFSLGDKFGSTVVRSNDVSYKDDNNLDLKISKNFLSGFKFGIASDFLFNDDSKSVSNNEFYDFEVMPFLEFTGTQNEYFKLAAGHKYNEKIKVESQGFVWAASAGAKDWKAGDYTLNGNVSDKNIYYGSDRTNGTLSADMSLAAEYSADDEVDFGMSYGRSSIDFLNFIGSDYQRWIYEMNTDKNFSTNLNVKYKPADFFHITSDLEYQTRSRDRNFNKADADVANSAFGKTSSLVSFKILNSIYLDLERLHSRLSGNFYSTEESFNAYAKSGPFIYSQLKNFQNLQKLNDYSLSRFEADYAGSLEIGLMDSISVIMGASIMHYDTPSEEENDEHDESGSYIGLNYSKYFGKNFSGTISAGIKNHHYVYLKAENSSQSNAVKSIMLDQSFELRYPKIVLNPKISLLATYHIYDFQKYLASVSSYNFRQISLEDSATVFPDGEFYLAYNSIFRYNKRGILYWSSFSEKPVTDNTELMNRLLLYNKVGIYTFGLGGSIYFLEQKDLETKKISHKSRVLSPQCEIGIKFSSDIFVYFIGKYDFQKIGNVSAHIANLNLKARILF